MKFVRDFLRIPVDFAFHSSNNRSVPSPSSYLATAKRGTFSCLDALPARGRSNVPGERRSARLRSANGRWRDRLQERSAWKLKFRLDSPWLPTWRCFELGGLASSRASFLARVFSSRHPYGWSAAGRKRGRCLRRASIIALDAGCIKFVNWPRPVQRRGPYRIRQCGHRARIQFLSSLFQEIQSHP